MRPILVSACLLGLSTRYDGQSKPKKAVFEFLRENGLAPIPICPEQLAGLPTPRPQTFFKKGDGSAVLEGKGIAVSIDDKEMNDTFIRGAKEALKVAKVSGCKEALLKERSPSCGVHEIYVGDRICKGKGVTSALLEKNGFKIFSEEDL